MLLQVDSLSVRFAQHDTPVQAVRDASFALDRGQALGIVGESGSGKSACCNALTGLLPPQSAFVSGSARLDGMELVNAGESALRRLRGARIGMVFQDPMTALNPHMRIGAQLMEPLRLHRGMHRHAAFQLATQWLDEVGIRQARQAMHCYPHQLSGGMRQRVLIAMALVAGPELLIADEPTTALDVSTQAQILALLDELRKRHNLGLVFVSHDLKVVQRLCDAVLVMREGEVVESGPCKKLFEQPGHAYTRALLDAIPDSAKPVEYRYPGTSAHTFRIDGVSVSYGSARKHQVAVSNASLQVARGEVLGLVGESGCGKSSLARAALRLLRLQQGALYLGSTALHTLRGKALRKARKQLQMVFQDPYASLNPRKTLYQALLEPLLLHGICRDKTDAGPRIDQLLAEVGLRSDWKARYPHELSGGQRQRVAIARALAVEPEYLVADEPVSALDVSVQAQVLDLLLRCCHERKIGMLFISHDIGVVRYVSDRVAVMHEGRIVEQGQTEALLSMPSHAYTRALLEASRLLQPGKDQ